MRGSAHNCVLFFGNTGSTPETSNAFQPQGCGLISDTVIACNPLELKKGCQLSSACTTKGKAMMRVLKPLQEKATIGEGKRLVLPEPRRVRFLIRGEGPVSAGAVTIECCPESTKAAGNAAEANSGRHFLSKRELAFAIGVSPRTVDTWMAQKRIPFPRFSARLIKFNLERVKTAIGRYEIKEVGRR